MAEQRPLTEQEFNAVLNRVLDTAPDGLDEATFQTLLDTEVAKAEQAVNRSTEHPHARTWRLVKENLPAIGAGTAVAATGGTALLPAAAAALLGGAGGSGLQQILNAASEDGSVNSSAGDVLTDMGVEGVKEGALQLGGGALFKGARGIARGLMKGAVPKPIATEYPNVDIPREMLNRGVFPGSARSARRVSAQSTAANAERQAAAADVPTMPRRRLIGEMKPLHAEATLAKEPEIADAMLDYMRTTARNVGKEGLTGAQQLARKTVKQRTGRAALNAGNPKEAAVIPQLAEAERSAITSHLRETPRMAKALDESQILMAIDDVMKNARHTNPVTRMQMGGVGGAVTAPVGLGITAHGINQAARMFDPNVLRALEAMMRTRSGGPRRRQP